MTTPLPPNPFGTTSSGSSAPGSSGSFPQTQGGAPTAADLAALNDAYPTAATWFAARGISSTEQPFYETGGKLNAQAFELEQFYTTSEADRLEIEDQLVSAGLLPQTDANGTPNSAAVTQFRNAQQNAYSTGVSTSDYLQQASTGTNAIENQIAAANASAEKLAAEPVGYSAIPTATLSQAIVQAFNQNIGFTPSQAQINQFISSVQGQEVAGAEAPHTEAKQMLAQEKTEQTALNNLGQDGVDVVMNAYQKAVSGLPGAGGQRGPQTGTIPGLMNAPPQISPPPTYTTKTKMEPVRQGFLGAAEANVGNLLNNPVGAIEGRGNQQMGQTIEKPVQVQVPSLANQGGPPTQFQAQPQPQYGGEFAMTPQEWKKAVSLLSAPLKKQAKATAGQSSETIQRAAFSALLQNEYDNNGGSWSKAVTSLASGTPLGTAKGKNIGQWATTVANQVNSQIENLQSQVNNSTMTVTPEKPTSTDLTAEAAQAAKQANPVGYYAANAATWGSFLTKALYGNPLEEMQPTTTFAGPVGSPAQTAESAAGNTAATAAATGT